jgi:hypothetical protein
MPKPLLSKLIAQAVIGFFFLLVGCVYGIHSKDDIFIILSLLIGLCSLIRTCSFYRLIHNEAYRVLSGTCIRQTSMPFKKESQIVLVDETQREYRLTLDKDSGLLPGHHYRFYFRKAVGLDSGDIDCSSMDLLGYEELPAVTEAV